MKKNELDSVIDTLKPLIDDLSEAAYERRPDPMLVRARAESHAQSPHPSQGDGSAQRPRPVREQRPIRRRWPVAAGAAAALTAAAVLAGVTLSGGDKDIRDGEPTRPASTERSTAINTRAFLLSSADTVAKQPATSGTCWYTRIRTWQDLMPFKGGRGVPTPMGPRRTFRAQTASTVEDWKCALPGTTRMRFRSHLPLDVRVTFPTKKDEAAWRAAGSPPLDVNGGTTDSKPFTTTYEKGSHLVNPVIGSHEIEWKTIDDLPATKQGLESHLRKLWRQDKDGGANGYTAPADFCQYVFVAAWDLFGTPTTPGTRASLYRILADCPSIRATEGVRDRMGRPGVALTHDGVRLIVAPDTARLLVFETFPTTSGRGRHAATEYMAYEHQGWVNKIGTVPGS